jgi:hypothetical protein
MSRLNPKFESVTFLLLLALATVTACSIFGPKTYHTILTGKSIDFTTLHTIEFAGKPQIGFKLNDEGTKFFAEYTDKHVGQSVAITWNKKVLTSPKILQPIRGGGVAIEGQFTLEEAQQIADEIKKNPERLEFVEAGDTPLRVGEIIQTTEIP